MQWCLPASSRARVQVVNRDMSVAVLRYFVEQRKRELEEGTFKNRKGRLSMAEAKAAHGAEADGGAPAEPVSAQSLSVRCWPRHPAAHRAQSRRVSLRPRRSGKHCMTCAT